MRPASYLTRLPLADISATDELRHLEAYLSAEHKCAAGEGSYAGLLDARFTACPRGAGAQNHREWEALLAGSIPVVDYDEATEELWEPTALPVVRVANWSAVTPEWLRQKWTELQLRSHSWAPVYLPYWLDRLLGSVTGPHGAGRGRVREQPTRHSPLHQAPRLRTES